MPPVTNRNSVPPFIVIGARGWCVSTKTGVWYGGSSPHQPFQLSSGHAPRTGPNMLTAFQTVHVSPRPRLEKRLHEREAANADRVLLILVRTRTDRRRKQQSC